MPGMEVLVISAIVFTGIIILLVGILTFAESKLVQKGNVKILINGDEEKSPTVQAGANLLNTLSNNGIFLPSACGGQGTCAIDRKSVV